MTELNIEIFIKCYEFIIVYFLTKAYQTSYNKWVSASCKKSLSSFLSEEMRGRKKRDGFEVTIENLKIYIHITDLRS